ncbi:MAG: ABC transporter permease [Solirubrobacterales bacterium]
MTALALRNFSARKLRAISTALAVFFGVAMIAGTLMLTDSVNSSFDELFTQANAGNDVTVRPHLAVEGDFGENFARAMPESLLDRVRKVDGVEKAAGAIGDDTITILDENGDRIGPPSGGPPHIAVSVVPPPFSPLKFVRGSPPTGDDQVAIDSITADEENYQLGQKITITGAAGASDYTLSGIAEFGNGAPLGGASLAEFTLAAAQRLTGKVGKLDEIDVQAAPGVTPAELAQRIQAVMPDNVDVRTGSETAAKDAGDIEDGFSFLTTALLVFAGIAVFVGAFLIFNTFSITVAQRAREFAMLRTLGASRRQVLATVLAEAALVGLLASVLGIAGGFGFVALIEALFKAMGFELPTSGLALQANTVLIPLAVGMLATLVSALFPALRATRVAPLEALRETIGATAEDASQRSRRRTVIASILIVGAVALLAIGLFGGGDTTTVLVTLGIGLVLLFVGLAMVGDRFVGPLASALGWPIERLRGVAGRLARENAQRQPGRTATTAAALMIGVALVVFVGVLAASIRASIADTLDRQFAGDLAIVNTDGFSPIPAGISTDVAKVDGVGVVSPVAMLPVRVEPGGEEPFIAGVEPKTIGSVANLDWADGSDATLSGLTNRQAILDEDWADKEGFGVGDTLAITGPSGDRIDVTVAGITHDSKFIVQNLALTHATLRAGLGARDDTTVFVDYTPGANQATARAAIDKLLADRFPNAEARSQEQYKQDQADQINQLVALIDVLLGLSVLISMFGVVNTLSLTIFERTRELGMLRAIGTSRRQVRRMIRYESVVTALLGAVTGAAVGLALAIAAVKALASEGLSLSIPATLPLVVLIAAILIGVVAAIGPARRASRINVLEALQYE